MGGLGSGCWDRDDYDKKISVEECYILDVNELARDGKLRMGSAGAYSWNDQYGEHPFRVDFSTILADCDCCRGRPILLLSYRWSDHWGEHAENVSLPIRLQTTFPNYGGQRWWFTCPLMLDGNSCNRRVGKLYLPPGARYFGCRHCHELVYRREPDPLEHAERFLEIHRKRMERAEKKHGSQD